MTLDRRAFLNACRCAGIASPLLPGILLTLATQAQEAGPEAKAPALPKVTDEMLDRAAELAGVGPFTAEQKKMMLDGLNDQRDGYAQIRALKLTNDVPPAYAFHPGMAAKEHAATCEPLPGFVDMPDATLACISEIGEERAAALVAPTRIEDIAFATVKELSELLAARKITSLALTQMYLDRLKHYDSKLHFVITLTEERALEQAKAADAEICCGEISRAAAWDSVGR